MSLYMEGGTVNKSQAKKKIMDVLVDKRGSVFAPAQSGRFMTILMHDLGLGSSSGSSPRTRGVVQDALESLERESKITLERVGQNIVGMARIKESRMDPTERSPQSKKEHMFAKGVPSRLPDELCSPVTVRHVDPSTIVKGAKPPKSPVHALVTKDAVTKSVTEKIDPPAQPSIEYVTGDRFQETLTACLNVLRAEADENGVGTDLSVKLVLECAGLTDSQTDRVLAFLRALELYTAKKTGYQKSTYTVALEPEVITAEMVRRARKIVNRSKGKKKAVPSDPRAAVLDQLAEIIEGLEQQLTSATAENEKLAKKLESAESKIATRDRQLETANARVADHDTKLVEAKDEITKLKQQLDDLQKLPAPVLSDKASAVLARYAK